MGGKNLAFFLFFFQIPPTAPSPCSHHVPHETPSGNIVILLKLRDVHETHFFQLYFH